MQVNIGIINENLSTTDGAVRIIGASPTVCSLGRTIPTHGDQLSHERMTDAKRARNADLTKRDKTGGFGNDGNDGVLGLFCAHYLG